MYEEQIEQLKRLVALKLERDRMQKEQAIKDNAVNEAYDKIMQSINVTMQAKEEVMKAAAEAGALLNGKDGPPGRDGKDGIDGLNGTDGRDGENGKDGAPGLNGINGKNGKDGLDGLNGKDGRSVDTAEIEGGDLILTIGGKRLNVGKVKGKDGARGQQGNNGRTAYEYAMYAGYEGSDEEFAEALSNIGSSGGGTWGSITGTLSDQEDLQEALDAKQDNITTGTGQIDFGAAPGGNTAEITVLDSTAKTTSTIAAFLSGTTTDHNEVEHLISDIKLIATPHNSSFSVSAFSTLRLTGTFKFNYTIT